jgi:cellulose synthase/poly-beta-1,6-N-acetylglucosamine synthase-like glycosyltransferase
MLLNILFAIYGLFCLILAVIWLCWPIEKKLKTESDLFLSIIIPVRNEAKNIEVLLQDLENQILHHQRFEVFIANDHSDDNTAELVEKFKSKNKLNLHLVHLTYDSLIKSPKKKAITTCINLAKGDIIVTTDGDCRVKKGWLKEIQLHFENNETVFLSAPVSFFKNSSSNIISKLWTQMQEIEFVSLIVSGACSIKMGFPNMCSGANIAYKKAAFMAVNGFEGNEHIASGDDEFLMHKMASHYPGKISYLKSQEAIVETAALQNMKSFYNQRKRWAGKWTHYKTLSPKLLAGFIFSINLSFIISLITGNLLLLLLKLIPEFIFLTSSLFFFKKSKLIFMVLVLQLIYPFYVVFFGLISLKQNGYVWKERQLY